MARTLKSILRAQGRLRKLSPVAIIDIGSNSVRLVVYEGLSRSPTPLFNEKILCGLGAHIATTGRLDDEAVERALAALRRFKMLAEQTGADGIFTLATAAAREAENGPAFIKRAKEILDGDVHVLSGAEEARYAALGIVCGFEKPVGVSADMGGGSVEFSLIDRQPKGEGTTFPLGGLRLQEQSGGSVSKARELCREALAYNAILKQAKGGTFYAVGGTWRALGRLHMARYGYPLSVMHHYEIDEDAAKKLCRRMMQKDASKARGLNAVSSNRRALIPYGAALLYEIMKVMKPEKIIFSGLGVREGYLYSLLPPKTQKADALLTAAEEMAVLRARSPVHSRELIKWTGEAFRVLGIKESGNERRYRKAACLLADVTWRSHPDYRGDQAFNLLSNADFVGVDHPGRAYIALASFYRHEGLTDDSAGKFVTQVAGDAVDQKARLCGALFRVGYVVSAAMPGVLPGIHFRNASDDALEVVVPEHLAGFAGERVNRRLEGLAYVTGRSVRWVVE